MGLISWGNKEKEREKDISILFSEIRQLKSELNIMRQEIEMITTNTKNLRGWLNRKIGGTTNNEQDDGDNSIKRDIEAIKAFFGNPIQNYQTQKDLIDKEF